MLPRNKATDWHSLWADLLQGMGAGLLHYDGSPLAQAALMGLEAFDAAQERSSRWDSRAFEFGPEEGAPEADTTLPPEMSAAEMTAFQRLSPEEQAAFLAELAEVDARAGHLDNDDRSGARQPGLPAYPGASGRTSPLPTWRPPVSASPFEGWSLETALPFSRDGRLKLPILRR